MNFSIKSTMRPEDVKEAQHKKEQWYEIEELLVRACNILEAINEKPEMHARLLRLIDTARIQQKIREIK